MRKGHRYSDESGQMKPDHSVLALRCWAQAPDLRDSLLDFLSQDERRRARRDEPALLGLAHCSTASHGTTAGGRPQSQCGGTPRRRSTVEGERSGRCYYSNLLVIELHACAQAMDHNSRQIARRQTDELGSVSPSTIGRKFSLSMSRGWLWLCAQLGLPPPKRREGLW